MATSPASRTAASANAARRVRARTCVQRLLLAVLATLAVACEAGPTVSGPARVVDGDSLEIGATRIRLFAIDAPEAAQTCGAPGEEWRCGAAATAALRTLVADRIIACQQQDLDDYGRVVAVCRNGEVDLGAAMVASGLARAYTRYGLDYVQEEEAAREARAGIWAGDHEAPWDWRRLPSAARTPSRGAASSAATSSRATVSARGTAPPGTASGAEPARGTCLIKGNINRAGERIYHLPGSRAYDDTQIDEARGERWFCSAEEAERAGWRASRGR